MQDGRERECRLSYQRDYYPGVHTGGVIDPSGIVTHGSGVDLTAVAVMRRSPRRWAGLWKVGMKSDRRVHLIRHVAFRLSAHGSDHITVKANEVKIGFIHQGSGGLFRFGFGDPACESPEEVLGWLVDKIAGHAVQGHDFA